MDCPEYKNGLLGNECLIRFKKMIVINHKIMITFFYNFAGTNPFGLSLIGYVSTLHFSTNQSLLTLKFGCL